MNVPVFVTSEQTSSERRVNGTWTLAELKDRLEKITGVPPQVQKLVVYPTSGNTENPIEVGEQDDNKTLDSFGITAYGRIHVEDTRPPESRGVIDLNDLSQVEKYVMPEDEYEQRQDSVLQWKKTNRLGRFDPANKENELVAEDEIEGRSVVINRGIEVNKRCQVNGIRIGTVKFVGKVPEINSKYWVGVEFDEPVGKNSGDIKGTKYFDCRDNHGSFVKPELVEIGDFEEEDFDEL